MGWFPVGRDEGGEWRLDIVALLAVTGESFIHEHSQAITSTTLCMLPRIMPAPQALMRSLRPASLPSEPARVTAVYSGFAFESLGFFANIIHPLDLLSPLSFQVFEVKWRGASHHRNVDEESNEMRSNPDGGSGNVKSSGADAEIGGPGNLRRRATLQERLSDFVTNAPGVVSPSGFRPAFDRTTAALWSPLNMLTMFSCFLTVGLIAAGVVWNDGTALLGIILISLASSIIGAGAWWRPILLGRRPNRPVPDGDLMIRTREGAFLLIRCSEDVARELYSGVEECHYYVSGRAYRVLMILGAILIMPAVILFGNCTFNMQLLVGAAYMVLNVMYWGLGLLPRHLYWDLSRYEWRDVTPSDVLGNDYATYNTDDDVEAVPSFTRALWYAIRETKRIGWVHVSGSAPDTEAWNTWLREAEAAARRGERDWKAVARKTEIMNRALSGRTQAGGAEAPTEN